MPSKRLFHRAYTISADIRNVLDRWWNSSLLANI